ncbi:hypothetical protein PR048_026869 [Dryococelus australis]|uniref:Uncharacterized protein n=1 Tax=Dryococelus australis TaxID=614101 RepID=A0ABQ9GMI7_9NEOP|nr:hypothetical protein PR048_026869 [Dryococelus australis]
MNSFSSLAPLLHKHLSWLDIYTSSPDFTGQVGSGLRYVTLNITGSGGQRVSESPRAVIGSAANDTASAHIHSASNSPVAAGLTFHSTCHRGSVLHSLVLSLAASTQLEGKGSPEVGTGANCVSGPTLYSYKEKEVMQGDMHRGREGLGIHGLHFGAITTSLSVLRASLNNEEQGKNREQRHLPFTANETDFKMSWRPVTKACNGAVLPLVVDCYKNSLATSLPKLLIFARDPLTKILRLPSLRKDIACGMRAPNYVRDRRALWSRSEGPGEHTSGVETQELGVAECRPAIQRQRGHYPGREVRRRANEATGAWFWQCWPFQLRLLQKLLDGVRVTLLLCLRGQRVLLGSARCLLSVVLVLAARHAAATVAVGGCGRVLMPHPLQREVWPLRFGGGAQVVMQRGQSPLVVAVWLVGGCETRQVRRRRVVARHSRHGYQGDCLLLLVRASAGSRNERVGETGGLRVNPPTSGIVRHDSHLQKSQSEPAGD